MISKVVTDTDHDAPFQSHHAEPRNLEQCQSSCNADWTMHQGRLKN